MRFNAIPDMVGIMFDQQSDDALAGLDKLFPTLADIEKSCWGHTMDLPPLDDIEEFKYWHAVAVNAYSQSYGGDEDRQATDETNLDEITRHLFNADDNDGDHDRGIPQMETRYVSGGWDWVTEGLDAARETGVAWAGKVLILKPCPKECQDATQHNHDSGKDCTHYDEQCNLCRNFEHVVACQKALADYPFLDEEAHAERDMEAFWEYARTAGLEEDLRDSEWRDNLDEDTFDELVNITLDDAEGLSLVCSNLHSYNGFTGSHEPNMAKVAVELFIKGLIAVGRQVGTWGWRSDVVTTVDLVVNCPVVIRVDVENREIKKMVFIDEEIDYDVVTEAYEEGQPGRPANEDVAKIAKDLASNHDMTWPSSQHGW